VGYDFTHNVRIEWGRQMLGDFEDFCRKDIVDWKIIEVSEPYRREVGVGRRPACCDRPTSTTRSIRTAIAHPLNRICSDRYQSGKRHAAANTQPF
jgi:hypothetical protein